MSTAAIQISVDASPIQHQVDELRCLLERIPHDAQKRISELARNLVDFRLVTEKSSASQTGHLIYGFRSLALDELIASAIGAFDLDRSEFGHGHGVPYAN
jgi:hypothetical protein